MTRASTPHSSEGLQRIEGLSFDGILNWLERALRGHESLPIVVPDESPEGPILRHERALSPVTRGDLHTACDTLIKRFVRNPRDDDDYAAALLRLGTGLKLREMATDLHHLASDREAFDKLPDRQGKAILASLLDLRAPVSLAFWQDIAERSLASHRVMAISGLLRHGFRAALDVICLLPNEEAAADSLYVILDQHARLLNPVELQNLANLAKEALARCAPQIQSALSDWIEQHYKTATEHSTTERRRSNLDIALASFKAARNETYEPRSRSAKLVPEAAAA